MDLIESLWRARGYVIDRADDETVVVVNDDTGQRTLWLHHTTRRWRDDPTPPDRQVDLVVTSGTEPPATLPPGSPHVIDATDLEGMLFYAIDRETATTIAERVFDEPVLADLRATPRAQPATQSRSTVVLTAVIVTLVLGTVVFTTMTLLPGDVSIDAIARAAQGSAAEQPPTEREAAESMVTTRQTTETGPTTPIRDLVHATYFMEYGDPSAAKSIDTERTSAEFPQGLTASGIENANFIAEVHARHIDNRSYRVEIEYQEFQNGAVESTYVERIAVESPSRYASTIEQRGTRIFDPPVVTRTAVFADGQTVTTEDGMNYSMSAGPETSTGYYTDRISTYLRWYLSVEESTIVDVVYQGNQTEYIVALGRDSWPDRVNSSGYARITDQGIVQYLRVKYRIPDSETTAEVTIRYVAIGNVEVSPPAWYTKNATRTPVRTPTPE